MKKLLLLIFCLLYAAAGYAQSSESISQEQAIDTAKQYLIDNGASPDWFGGYVGAYFAEGNWIILFNGKPDVNGLVADDDQKLLEVSSDGTVSTTINTPFTYPPSGY